MIKDMRVSRLAYMLLAVILAVACNDDKVDIQPSGGKAGSIVVKLHPKVADNEIFTEFSEGDKLGLYVVNYNGNNPGGVAASGNQVDNALFEYNATTYGWRAESEVYFRDDKTKVDVIAYTPHKRVSDIGSLFIAVANDQSTGLESSKFMWCRERGIMPTASGVEVVLNPLVACIEVSLTEGEGWDSGEWQEAKRSVAVTNTQREAYLNLVSGNLRLAESAPTEIKAYREGNIFRALVVPQSINGSTRLICAEVNGSNYYISTDKKLTLEAGKKYSYELKIDKRGGSAKGDKLSGTIIGTRYSVNYDTGAQSETVNGKTNVFDGDYDTFFASYDRSNTWVGLDLGAKHIITAVGYSPRVGQPSRVVTALVEGANNADFSDALPLYIIRESAPEREMTYATINCSRGFRYVRYVTPNDKRCNLAELEFFGYEGEGDDSQLYQLTNLPTVVINTANAEEITSKEVEITSTVYIISNDGTSLLTDTATGVRGRGNASWNFEKKPYRLKFSEKRSPLGAPAEAKKWTLLSNHGDKTLMRNILAFEVSRRLGMAYTPFCYPVDVVINGEYKGCYQLCDQIDVRPNRVDVVEMKKTDNSGTNLTGGYLVEIDAYASTTEKVYFYSTKGTPVTIKSPDDEDITAEQCKYIEDYFNLMEASVFASNYADAVNGYRKYLDLESYLRLFIVGEFTGNTDTYWSVYMYKQRGDDRFYFGPVWDYDLAFENDYRTYPINNTDDFLYCGKSSGASDALNQMNNRIIKEDRAAREELKVIWNEAKLNGIDEASLLEYVDETAALLDESQRLNFLRWPILNQWVHMNFQALGSYEAELGTVKTYIKERIPKLDELISNY